MKLLRNILISGLFYWLLAACGSHGASNCINQAQLAIGDEESEQDKVSSLTVNIDEMIMQELCFLRTLLYAGNKIALSPDEQALVDRIDRRIAQLQQGNYIHTKYDTTANILNIVNMFQFREITSQEMMDDLAVYNYTAVPDSLPQLFQVYQRNASQQIPNFVTVDLMAQFSHIYENYVLRTVEERFFVPMLTKLCLDLYGASVEQANKTTQENMKDMAIYNASFFAIAYHLLTGKSLKIQGDYQHIVEEELAYISQQENRRPALLDRRTDFDYSVFKPYGHYTRTALLRRYFKAWKWLQLAPYCGDSKTQQQRAVLAALALQTDKNKSDAAALDLYTNLCGAMKWFYGQHAFTSVLDIALLLKKERITTITAALDARFLSKLDAMLISATSSNTLAVKYPASCRNGIYFFPQPAYAEETASRDVSSYNKRLESIHVIQQKPHHSPVFAQKQAWNQKNLKTSSALGVKLNHDVLLYGIIPNHPDPLPASSPVDTLLPESFILGYVEPALPFWTKLREWVELTDKTLKDHLLTTDTLTIFTERLHRYVALLENAAFSQLNNERLSDETYRFMAHIGDSIQQFTLSMIEPEIDRWDWAAGTDKSVAVFKKINLPNVTGNLPDSIMYKAVGNINCIYVIVEIDGFLYLTKGAAFSYHEFFMPSGNVLQDKDWVEMKKNLFEY